MTTMTTEVLLSDQFAEFSGKVTALHEKKKELLAELKKIHEDYKSKIKAIDEEAGDLQSDFSSWAAAQTNTAKIKPGPTKLAEDVLAQSRKLSDGVVKP